MVLLVRHRLALGAPDASLRVASYDKALDKAGSLVRGNFVSLCRALLQAFAIGSYGGSTFYFGALPKRRN